MRLSGWTPSISSHETASIGALQTSFVNEWSRKYPDHTDNISDMWRHLFRPSVAHDSRLGYVAIHSVREWIDDGATLGLLDWEQCKWAAPIFAHKDNTISWDADADVYQRPSDQYLSDFYEYSEMKHQSVAAYHVFQRMSRLLTNQRYLIINEMMAKADPTKMSVPVMLAFLRISLGDKHRFRNWSASVSRVYDELAHRKKNASALMADILA